LVIDLIQDEVFQLLQEHLEIVPDKYITMIYRNFLQADFTVFRENWYKTYCKI